MQDFSRRSLIALLGAGVATTLGMATASAAVIIEERVIPEVKIEVIPPAPHPGWSWVPGHWVWQGRNWVWVRGHYIAHAVRPMPALIVEERIARPSPRHSWIRGHWAWSERRGDWIWVKGHWVL